MKGKGGGKAASSKAASASKKAASSSSKAASASKAASSSSKAASSSSKAASASKAASSTADRQSSSKAKEKPTPTASAPSVETDEVRVSPTVQKIIDVLTEKFPPPCPIPLNYGNAFQFLCAVVLSAQTTDGKVNEVTNVLFTKVKCPLDMVQLGLDSIATHIKSLGLYQNKAKFLFGLSQKLLESADYHSGERVPNTKEELTQLPGVGNKTASVVLSQIFNVPSIAVDTHVHRCSLRWGLTKEKVDATKVQKDLEKIFPSRLWNQLHLQIIYFGREYCQAKLHDTRQCPICSFVVHGEESPSKVPASPSTSPHKGIIFYSDRQKELTDSPQLTGGKRSLTNL